HRVALPEIQPGILPEVPPRGLVTSIVQNALRGLLANGLTGKIIRQEDNKRQDSRNKNPETG
ncbi:MAG TPA: hypothetical protein PLW31_03315, partial [Bacteroidales bacterium]|nr:hypothetical protein [Bacteroidales bacterium]